MELTTGFSPEDRFMDLVEGHKGIIYKVSNTYCRNAEDRKDLVQEIIVQLWNSFSKYDDRLRWSTWMYRIALNVAISFYRKEKRRTKSLAPFAENIILIDESDKQAVSETDIELLNQFIDQLDKLNKALMILYLDNHSYSEISDILGISVTNVATKISRVKEKLKRQFSKTKVE